MNFRKKKHEQYDKKIIGKAIMIQNKMKTTQ